MQSLIQIRFGYTSLTARFYPELHPNYKLHLGVNFPIMGALFKYLVTYLMMTRVQIGTGSKYWTQCVTYLMMTRVQIGTGSKYWTQ